MAAAAVPVYFETSWSILSTIGIVQAVMAGLVISITTLSGLSILPVILGFAGAVANGLCYYAFYANYSDHARMGASAVADIMWLIQEAGLSFYSYQILIRVLNNKTKVIFMVLFWTLILSITGLRCTILVYRQLGIASGGDKYQKLVNSLHCGYFTCIALCECVSSFFLLKSFLRAHSNAKNMLSMGTMTGQLVRSTETRLAALALIGITRAVTYSFQQSAQKADVVPSQVDRFVYTLECMFPFIMIIDLLASRLAGQGGIPSKGNKYSKSGQPDGNEMTAMKSGIIRHQETIVLTHKAGASQSSQMPIMEDSIRAPANVAKVEHV